MRATAKPTRGPDPDTGRPTYDMIFSLLSGLCSSSYRDYQDDPAYIEASAKAAARFKELEADPELTRYRKAAAAAEAAFKAKAARLAKRAEQVKRRLQSEGLTTAVLRLAQALVKDAEK